MAQGSGFFVSNDGIVATNLHVLESASSLQVETATNETYDVVYFVIADPRRDLALIKVPLDAAPFLTLAAADAEVGQKVFAIGNPLGQVGTFSDGVLSAHRNIDGVALIQITAPISSGSSGGPVVDSRGEVLGIATMMLRGGQNLNYAVPSRYIRPLMTTNEAPRRFSSTLLPRRPGSVASTATSDRRSSSAEPSTAERAVRGEVMRQFERAEPTLRNLGYSPVGQTVHGSLREGSSTEHQVRVGVGNYAVIAYCDNDCTDLDLHIVGPFGDELDSDLKTDDRPMVHFSTYAAGEYRLRVSMAACSIEPCRYGARLYRAP